MDTTSTLFGLVLMAYGWIFRSTIARIKKIEDKPERKCHYPEVNERIISFGKKTVAIEKRQDNLQPVLMDIKATLAELKEAIKWIKESR